MPGCVRKADGHPADSIVPLKPYSKSRGQAQKHFVILYKLYWKILSIKLQIPNIDYFADWYKAISYKTSIPVGRDDYTGPLKLVFIFMERPFWF